jgi:endoribonuclease Dicer
MAAEAPKPKSQPPTPDYVPRLYQTELVDMAKEKNVVAYLDTGAGKTFIAVLLLRHRIDAFRLATATTATSRTRKNCDDAGNDPYPSAAPATSSLPATKPSFLAVFLAPRVSLVQQQAEVLARHLPARVKSFIGETTEHWWTDPMAGRAELTAIEVAVMTPQVLVNTLNHAVLRNICAIDTIVLDEAHHCRKKDPTNVAMEFYRRASRDPRRPLVLGLTAAPAMASQRSKNVLKSLRELETNLDATVVTVRDRAELEEIVPPVSIVVERYPADKPPTAVKDLENALESTAERLDAVIAEAQ